MVIVTCKHCNRSWDYNGKSLFWLTCPACYYKLHSPYWVPRNRWGTMGLISLLLLVFLVLPVSADVTSWNWTVPGTYSWTAPAGVTNVTLTIGGGGGSGMAASANSQGLGGSAGAFTTYARVATTPGTSYTIIVGAGGANATLSGTSNAGTLSSALGYSKAGGSGGVLFNPYAGSPVAGNGGDGAGGFWNTTRYAFNGTNASGSYIGGTSGLGKAAGGGGGSLSPGWYSGLGGGGANGLVVITVYNSTTTTIPNFIADSTNINPGTSVRFTDLSTIVNGSAITYNWSWGDGTYSSATGSTTHVYSYTGTYDVSLTLIDAVAGSVTELKSSYITVTTSTTSQIIPVQPRAVSFKFIDEQSNPIYGSTVTAAPVNTSLPSTSISWLISAFGISSTVASQMVDGTLVMTGGTDSDGAISFVTYPVIQYNITVTNASMGVSRSLMIYPQNGEYTIAVQTTGTVTPTGSYVTFTLNNVTKNATHEFYNVSYQDTTGGTSLVRLIVTNQSKTELYNGTVSGFGTGATALSSGALLHNPGDTFTARMAATQSSVGFVNKSITIQFMPTSPAFGNFPPWVSNWIATGALVLLAAAFSILSVKFALIIVPIFGFFELYYLRWLQPAIGVTAMSVVFGVLFMLGILMYIRKSEATI